MSFATHQDQLWSDFRREFRGMFVRRPLQGLKLPAGADVANLLDNDHYEAFGGDLLGRRALGHLTYSW